MDRGGQGAVVGVATGLGLAAGAAMGVLELHRGGDLGHAMVWLASLRFTRILLLGGLYGAGVGVLLLLWPAVSAFAQRRGAGARRPAHLALATLVLLAITVAVQPSLGSLRADGYPSVVLVSIDTLRADRFEQMPRLRVLAAEGTTFAQAISAAPWTLPSHVSVFTSMLPFDHRVQWTHTAISPRRTMLAERFRDAGYRTGAFTGASYVSGGFGFDQGFEVYEDHNEMEEGGSHAIFGHALRWARRMRGRPFFLFVHTYEPHFPYMHSEGVTAPRGRLGAGFTMENVEAAYRGDLRLNEQERQYVRALYDAGVRGADTHVGAFLSALREEGILDGAILVVLSDHGEDLWDHVESRSPGHGHALYEELVHVPLMFRAPGRIAPGKRMATPVSLLDVAPTLLDLCGLAPDRSHRGHSLAHALRTGREPVSRPVLSESIEHGPDRFAWRLGSLKAILTPYPERVHMNVHLQVRPVEIFDLARDRLERDPESGRQHPDARIAFAALVERSRRASTRAVRLADQGNLPEELRAQLRSLGYLR